MRSLKAALLAAVLLYTQHSLIACLGAHACLASQHCFNIHLDLESLCNFDLILLLFSLSVSIALHRLCHHCRFGQAQSQPGIFGASQQPQQQNQQQLSLFGASQQPQQQGQQQSGLFGAAQGPQQQPFTTTQLAAGVAPASQEIVAISRAFDKSSNDYRFRHLFLNVVDNPGSYGCPPGKNSSVTCACSGCVHSSTLHPHSPCEHPYLCTCEHR